MQLPQIRSKSECDNRTWQEMTVQRPVSSTSQVCSWRVEGRQRGGEGCRTGFRTNPKPCHLFFCIYCTLGFSFPFSLKMYCICSNYSDARWDHPPMHLQRNPQKCMRTNHFEYIMYFIQIHCGGLCSIQGVHGCVRTSAEACLSSIAQCAGGTFWFIGV